MAGAYGISKIGVATITDANVQYLQDTDLGINMTQQKAQQVLGTTNMTQGPIKKYPVAVRNTSTAAGTITVVMINGDISTLGNVQAGQTIPINFAQIQGAGTGLAAGVVQIFYK